MALISIPLIYHPVPIIRDSLTGMSSYMHPLFQMTAGSIGAQVIVFLSRVQLCDTESRLPAHIDIGIGRPAAIRAISKPAGVIGSFAAGLSILYSMIYSTGIPYSFSLDAPAVRMFHPPFSYGYTLLTLVIIIVLSFFRHGKL